MLKKSVLLLMSMDYLNLFKFKKLEFNIRKVRLGYPHCCEILQNEESDLGSYHQFPIDRQSDFQSMWIYLYTWFNFRMHSSMQKEIGISIYFSEGLFVCSFLFGGVFLMFGLLWVGFLKKNLTVSILVSKAHEGYKEIALYFGRNRIFSFRMAISLTPLKASESVLLVFLFPLVHFSGTSREYNPNWCYWFIFLSSF